MVELPLMVRWVVGSIPHGGPIELFLVLFQPVLHAGVKRLWCVLSCLWDGAYQKTFAANRKE